ncbi:MAG TPA: hypothetical protein VLQ45_12410 [Thermoanaerobaculia bacterium]|nr:hypothetical protein [Thermoanaerobaculia bacterium]
MTRPLSPRLRLVPCLLAFALAAGCSPSPDSPQPAETPAAAQIDACTLFTWEDAQAIANEAVGAMSSTLDDARGRDPGQCVYNAGTLDQPRILSLLLRQFPSAASAQRVLASSRSTFDSMSGGKVQEVPGLGDGALWVGGRIQQLHVVRGSTQLVITAQSPDGTDQLAVARQIADRAIARLGASAG